MQEVRDGLGRRLRAAGIPRALADGLIAKIAAIPRRPAPVGHRQRRTGGPAGPATGTTLGTAPRPMDMTVDAHAPARTADCPA